MDVIVFTPCDTKCPTNAISYHKIKNWKKTHLNSFIGVHDDGDEHTEYNINKETDEEIEVDATVPPYIATGVTDD